MGLASAKTRYPSSILPSSGMGITGKRKRKSRCLFNADVTSVRVGLSATATAASASVGHCSISNSSNLLLTLPILASQIVRAATAAAASVRGWQRVIMGSGERVI